MLCSKSRSRGMRLAVLLCLAAGACACSSSSSTLEPKGLELGGRRGLLAHGKKLADSKHSLGAGERPLNTPQDDAHQIVRPVSRDGHFRCGTSEIGIEEREEALQARLEELGFTTGHRRFLSSVTIQVYVHSFGFDDCSGVPSTQQVVEQIDVLNKAFDQTSFSFELATEISPSMVIYCSTALTLFESGTFEEMEVTSVREGGMNTLNIYVTNLGVATGLLGYATFPVYGVDSLDGIVVDVGTLPGNPDGPYNLGDTVVHEVGHWLGLFHTFQGGCSPNNDFVSDTPASASPTFGCPQDRDSCEAEGADPIDNFMDYTDDNCMDHFTPGQTLRMEESWTAFREECTCSSDSSWRDSSGWSCEDYALFICEGGYYAEYTFLNLEYLHYYADDGVDAGMACCACGGGTRVCGVDMPGCSVTCDGNATCSIIYTMGASEQTCKCNSGYAGSGVECSDVDECTSASDSADNCDPEATCINTEGSFVCRCNENYHAHGSKGTKCDLDECSAGTHDCDAAAKCTDTDGSFTCECNAGFSGIGHATEPAPLPIWYGNASTSLFPEHGEGQWHCNADGNGWHAYLGQNMPSDKSYRLIMPFRFICGIDTTNGFHVGTNSYITFGRGASDYYNLGPSKPSVPTLFIGGGDHSAQLILGKSVFEEGPGYVVHFEGTDSWQGEPGGSPNILWEATLFENGMIRVVTAQHADTAGLFGLSDGAGNWLALDKGAEHAVYTYMIPVCNSSQAQAGAYVKPAVAACALDCPEFHSCGAAEAFCQNKTESDGLKDFKCRKVAGLFGEYECSTSNPAVNCIGSITLDGCELEPVALGNAGHFAVLAGAAVTSSGLTQLRGDLGVSPGTSVTGFNPPGKMLGDSQIHSADRTSAKGMAALSAAYNDATARDLCQHSAIGNLGGRTLAPGLYKSTSGMAIAPAGAELTLDAGHNSEAVWIFQMVSTFISAVSTKIVLKNGANASNVFWQVGSSGTLGTGSHLEGSMLAYASITLGARASVHGRVLAQTAAVTMLTDSITIPAEARAASTETPSPSGALSKGFATDSAAASTVARQPSDSTTSNSLILIAAASGVAGLVVGAGGVLLVLRSRVSSPPAVDAELRTDPRKDVAQTLEEVIGDVRYTIDAALQAPRPPAELHAAELRTEGEARA